jgi:enoyl-[acyl-carrier protein] reductase II
VPRSLWTHFIEEWQGRGEEARRRAPELAGEIGEAVQSGRMFERVPFTGESAGLINEVLPVVEIIRRLVDEAERCLRETPGAVGVTKP